VTAFTLDPRLEADTLEIASLPLSVVRLMNDRRFPWVILVPARPGAIEIVDLAPADRAALIEEVAQVSAVMRELFRPAKLNVAALGNVVPQLHVHVVARFTTDAAWPNPVWGSPREPYRFDEVQRTIGPLRYRLAATA
jgi:diadenosine tetraphosphate (Ap4A) HIT family hydrolase